MKASQVVARSEVRLVEADEPTFGSRDVLIKPLFVAICGSDLYRLHYSPEDGYPQPVGSSGHEMVGLVVQTGSEVTRIQPGDKVLGLVVAHDAMQELCVLDEHFVIKLPPGRTMEEYLMAQQLGTVLHSCGRLPNMVGKTAVIVGQGSAGLFFTAMLKRMGVRTVIAMDLEEARLRVSEEFGADEIIINRDIDPVERVRELTDGAMADLVVEAAGEVETINLVSRLIRLRGQIVFFGIPHKQEFVFDYWSFFRSYASSYSFSGAMEADDNRVFRMALDLISVGDIRVDGMITHRYTIEDVVAAYDRARFREDGAVKVLVELPGAEEYRNTVLQ